MDKPVYQFIVHSFPVVLTHPLVSILNLIPTLFYSDSEYSAYTFSFTKL